MIDELPHPWLILRNEHKGTFKQCLLLRFLSAFRNDEQTVGQVRRQARDLRGSKISAFGNKNKNKNKKKPFSTT